MDSTISGGPGVGPTVTLPDSMHEISSSQFESLSRLHVKKLKDEYLGEKVQRYFDLLPEVLREMFPDFDTMGEG